MSANPDKLILTLAQVQGGELGAQTLFVQHDAQWIEEGLPGAEKLLIATVSV
jgi:hypothetical protein